MREREEQKEENREEEGDEKQRKGMQDRKSFIVKVMADTPAPLMAYRSWQASIFTHTQSIKLYTSPSFHLSLLLVLSSHASNHLFFFSFPLPLSLSPPLFSFSIPWIIIFFFPALTLFPVCKFSKCELNLISWVVLLTYSRVFEIHV